MARLDLLRKLMREHQLDAYIIPTDDAHQSEYIADCDKRREFISGFTGSAGLVVVTQTKALLWTDGRYHLQASQELNSASWTLMRQGTDGIPTPEEWLASNFKKGEKIGYDPNLVSHGTVLKYSKKLKNNNGAALLCVSANLVDIVWEDARPPRPNGELLILQDQYSGQCWQEKIGNVREAMKEKEVFVLVVTALDEVAWLFNLRGTDIQYNPVFFSYALVTMDDVRLYIFEERTRSLPIVQHLQGVKLCLYSQVNTDLQQVISTDSNRKIWISSDSSHALVQLVPDPLLCSLPSPIQLLKGIKNEVEIEGMRSCHIRDSAALCEYFSWLEREVPKGELDEVSAANHLEEIRKKLKNFVSLSFPTISSSGPNGAIIHYHPTQSTARKLSVDEIYLCDSGAQYLDGTTDVTRTVSFGQPKPKEMEGFTLVLKGHIALCSAIFPNKTLGNQLDVLARHALWNTGLDYNHGTGHGVGFFLNVHEGPHGISKRRAYTEPFQHGMLVTDEPGYYEDGVFGVRIENVELIRNVETKYNFGGCQFLTMEPLTLVPIQQKMIDVTLLTEKEVQWVNKYHSTCLEVVGDHLQKEGKTDVLKWLQQETLPINRN